MHDLNALYSNRVHNIQDFLKQMTEPSLKTAFYRDFSSVSFFDDFLLNVINSNAYINMYFLSSLLENALNAADDIWEQVDFLAPICKYHELICSTPAVAKDAPEIIPEYADVLNAFRWIRPEAFIGAAKNGTITAEFVIDSFSKLLISFIKESNFENKDELLHDVDVVTDILNHDNHPINSISQAFATGNMNHIGSKLLSFDDWEWSDLTPDRVSDVKGPFVIKGKVFNKAIFSFFIRMYLKCEWNRIIEQNEVFDRVAERYITFANSIGGDMHYLDSPEFDINVTALAIRYLISDEDMQKMPEMIHHSITFINKYAAYIFPGKSKNTLLAYQQKLEDLISGFDASEFEDTDIREDASLESILFELGKVDNADDDVESMVPNIRPVVNMFGVMTIMPATEAFRDDQATDGQKLRATKKINKADNKAAKRQARHEKMHATAQKGYSMYKKYTKNAKEIDGQLGHILTQLKRKITNTNSDKYRQEIIGGKELSPMKVLSKAIAYAGVFSYSKILGIATLVVRYYNGKKTNMRERRKAMVELQHEIEILDEKINDAQAAGDRKAKYEMMRTRNALKSSLDSIKANVSKTPDKDIALAKKALINVEVNPGAK